MNCKMKYIIQVLAVIILFGCSDEDPFRSNGDISVTAGFTNTRTSFTEANGVTHVSWNTGDGIGLISKEQANLKYMAQSAGKETSFKAASSKLNAADGETVYAYYPYSESSESKDHIALPVMVWQNYTNDVTKLDFVYTTGKVADNKLALQFKHLLAFIKLTIPLDLIPDRGGTMAGFSFNHPRTSAMPPTPASIWKRKRLPMSYITISTISFLKILHREVREK